MCVYDCVCVCFWFGKDEWSLPGQTQTRAALNNKITLQSVQQSGSRADFRVYATITQPFISCNGDVNILPAQWLMNLFNDCLMTVPGGLFTSFILALKVRMALRPAAAPLIRRRLRVLASFCIPTRRATASGGNPSCTGLTVTTNCRPSPYLETRLLLENCEYIFSLTQTIFRRFHSV